MGDVLSLSALEQANLIRTRAATSVELTQLYLNRIEQLDPKVQSYVTVLRRRAMWAAKRADAQLSRSPDEALPIFFGVPCAIKDLMPVRGTPTKLGSRAFRYFISPFDVRAAKMLRRSGIVMLGKSATSEFGVLPVTEPDIHPPTRNPWNLDHTPGGSSGGSGAAVAAGLAPIAHGSDGGGSIRIPAAFCHLYGFKPSRALLGNLHGKVNYLGISVMGPLCHTVDDAAAFLDVLRDRPFSHLDYLEDSCLAATKKKPRRLKVLVSIDSPLVKTEPEIRAAVERVVKLLQELGHELIGEVVFDGRVEDFLPLWQLQMSGIPAVSEKLLQPVTRWLRKVGKRLDREHTLQLRDDLQARILTSFGDADIVVTPTVAVFAPKVGQYDGMPPDEAFFEVAKVGAFTAGFNVSGQPGANIPAGINAEGLPFGVQIVGRPDGDADVLMVSKQLEEAMPWRRARPKGFA